MELGRRQLFANLGSFATVFLASFEPDSRRAVVANAGHSPVIYKGDGERPRLLQADAVPIGVVPDWESTDLTFRLGPKDLLIAATDGFSEAENPHTSELFGYERLLDLVDQVAKRDAAEIANALFEATDAFSSGMEAGDDRTVVVLRGVD